MKTSVAIAALVLTMSFPGLASAQTTSDRQGGAGRWNAFFGCWTPDRRNPSVPSVQRCVLPALGPEEIRLVTYSGDSLVLEETLAADGRPQQVNDTGCAGWLKMLMTSWFIAISSNLSRAGRAGPRRENWCHLSRDAKEAFCG